MLGSCPSSACALFPSWCPGAWFSFFMSLLKCHLGEVLSDCPMSSGPVSHIILGAPVSPPALINRLLFASPKCKPHADRGLRKLGLHCLAESGPAPGREQEPVRFFVEQRNDPMKPGLSF